METRRGKRTAFVDVQIVEEREGVITMFFQSVELAPIVFRQADVPPAHWQRLQQMLELA